MLLYVFMAYRDKEKQREYAKKHYQANKELAKARAKAHTNKTRELVRQHIREYLSQHSCVDCGELDIVVLEFDHLDRSTKRFNIGDAVSKGYSLTSVKEEIAKCAVRCANCHRRKTFYERQLGVG